MPYGYGYGRGMGFGFRGSSPPWPYVGRGRGGLPRCGYFLSGPGRQVPAASDPYYYGNAPAGAAYPAYGPAMGREEELDYLRNQSQALRDELEELEARIKSLSADKE